VRQVSHRFHFSGSLPFFAATPAGGGPDFRPPPVTKTELDRYPEVFNFSVIPYSGKWLYVEPEEGQRQYADLDQYVGWCETNNIAMEFHFLSGYAPPWLKKKSATEKAELYLAHARDLVTRYGSRIPYWQVVNEQQLLRQAPAVFREIRRLAPDLKLGISDCTRFCVPEETKKGQRKTFRGLPEIRWLKEQGVMLDFFGFHGHRPFGVWPEPWEMYEALDVFAREGVKIHITEFGLPLGGNVVGNGRQGTWTPELQAEFYEWIFTVCFSHPAVELMNLWGFGPDNWQKGAGLLDEEYQPKPAFHALRKLIRERWHTEQDGTLGLGGAATVRGYHGDYELLLSLADGQTARATVAIEPDRENRYRFRLDRETGTLSRD
ncbi:endo-1,4-beta-xylanase, partial [bacterium]|nr:endo-1,4-beta-xylanase [bacterium]